MENGNIRFYFNIFREFIKLATYLFIQNYLSLSKINSQVFMAVADLNNIRILNALSLTDVD